MMMIMSLVFLIPLCFLGGFWEIMNFIVLVLFVYLNSFYLTDFFCGLSYSYGGDFFSMSMVFLSFWIVVLMILSGSKVGDSARSFEFLFLCVLMILFLLLCFMTTNIFMFYIYFEASLIPIIIMIFGWGYQLERLNAGFYLLFYTLFGSLPMLVGVLYLGFVSGSYFWFYLVDVNNFFLCVSMLLAFLIKLPIFMFHFWLLKAHVEAPVFGSMILAGVLLKLGGYGLFRVLPFLYSYCLDFSFFFVSFGLVSVIVSGFICLFQVDIKCLIAYSSVAHMGMVICGFFTFNIYGLFGSFVLMIGHGLCSSGLFVLAGIVYDRFNSRSLFINSGLISIMPSLSLFWFLLCVNNMSSPPSLNLLGELFLFKSIMSWSYMSMLFLMVGSFLNCCYTIYLYCMTQHGSTYGGILLFMNVNVREYLLVFLHWFPLNFFILSVDFFFF